MQPAPHPIFLNVEYFFFLVSRSVANIFTLQFLEMLRIVATILVIVFITWILYLLIRLQELKKEKDRKKASVSVALPAKPSVAAAPSGDGKAPDQPTPKIVRNDTWEAIRSKMLSDSQSDWRLAIIEADIYMDKLLDDKGYHGDTTSDKLKQVVTGDLASIQLAWEAHKVRNRIAHDGSAFSLTQPEARRVLSYFEIVFRDLGVIE